MASIQDALLHATGASQDDVDAIMSVLTGKRENAQNCGFKADEPAAGPFLELDPSSLCPSVNVRQSCLIRAAQNSAKGMQRPVTLQDLAQLRKELEMKSMAPSISDRMPRRQTSGCGMPSHAAMKRVGMHTDEDCTYESAGLR